ncbi:hypothetical protein [Altibacter sp. HG106]|uniref:hypothetical protein n=1 Tax=Altibacter sp. HG106 TaxID=3023937 RepID=UPI00235050DD|nr:hypothetical protein [Altibacter sp. HG106]MDC7994726.1 hypothetical protein [Altibacter sp. HG106]
MKHVWSLLLFIICTSLQAQVGINTTAPDPSAMLDITAIDKGVLIPRMTEAQKNAIGSPAIGLLVFQTDGSDIGFHYFNGSSWDYLAANTAQEIDDLSDGIYQNLSLYLGDTAAPAIDGSEDSNIGVGPFVFRRLTNGSNNISIGILGNEFLTTGDDNINIGNYGLERVRTGSNNIAIGNRTGMNMDFTSSGNILIGNEAGNGDFSIQNRLYIENSDAGPNSALLYGEFDNDLLRVNGTLEVNNELQVGSYTFPTSDGATGEVLTTDGSGNVFWNTATSTPTPSVVRADMSTNHTVAVSTITKINFDTDVIDTNNDFNTSSERFIASQTGLYQIAANITISGTGTYVVIIAKNGAPPGNTLAQKACEVVTTETVSFSTVESLNPNDYIELYIFANDPATILALSVASQFMVYKID